MSRQEIIEFRQPTNATTIISVRYAAELALEVVWEINTNGQAYQGMYYTLYFTSIEEIGTDLLLSIPGNI